MQNTRMVETVLIETTFTVILMVSIVTKVVLTLMLDMYEVTQH